MSDDALDIRSLELAGIRTLHVPRPGLTRATLHFGVGLADEAFSTRGITHLIEHLAMGVTDRSKYERNAAVGRRRTSFWAAGSPSQVAEFLAQLGRALCDLPLERLEREKGVLDAEYAQQTYDCHDVLLHHRFGNVGLGLGVYPGLGSMATDPDTLREHVSRWFVRQNAVLTVVGALPDELEVDLPEGQVPAHSHVDRLRVGPGWLESQVGDPVFGFVAAAAPETLLAVRLMAAALEHSLRQDRGIIYGIRPAIVRHSPTGMVVAQFAPATAPGSEQPVAEAMAAEFMQRLDFGATAEELADDLDGLDAFLADPDSILYDLDSEAERTLAGLPVVPRSTLRATMSAITGEQVASTLRDAVGSALLLVPTGLEPETEFARSAGCSVAKELTTPELKRRRRSKAARGTALGFSVDAVQYRDEDSDVHEVRIDECVGVGVGDEVRLIFGLRGCHVWVHSGDYRGADAVVRAIDERIPANLRYPLG